MSCYLAIESGRLWFLAQVYTPEDFGLNYHQKSDTFIARSVGLQLTLNDFQKVSDKVPFLADLKPSGKYVMEDVHKIGGTPAIIRYYWNLGFKTRIVLRVFGAWKMVKYNGE